MLFAVCAVLISAAQCNKVEDTPVDTPKTIKDNEEKEDKEKTELKEKEAAIKVFNTAIGTKSLPYKDLREKVKSGKVGTKEPKLIEEKDPEASGDFSCTVKKYSITAEYNENILLDPAASTFYPGAMVRGETIEEGSYKPLGLGNRTPMTMSISLENIAGKVSRDFDPGTISDARQKIRDILAQELTGATAARVNFVIETVYNKEQLNLAIGAGFQYSGAITSVDLSADFGFDKKEVKTRLLIKFIQQYYSIDVDPKAKAADYFTAISKEDPATFAGMPLFVSSIKYGRMVIFTVESNESEQNVRAAFSAAFQHGPAEGNVDVEASHQKVIKNSTIKATIIGGSGSEAVGAISGVEGLLKYIKTGENYTKDSPAAPLAYTLRSVSDNAIMKSFLASEYNIRNCELVSLRYRITMLRFEDINAEEDEDEIELYGRGMIEFLNVPKDWTGSTSIDFFLRSRNEFLKISRRKGITIDLTKSGNYTWDLEYNKNSGQSISILLNMSEYDGSTSNPRARNFLGTDTRQIDLSKLKAEEFNTEIKFGVQNGANKITLVYKIERLPAVSK